MKKVFSKELWKKFLVAMMIMVTAMWLAPEEVHAGDGIGGKLAEPVADLIIVMGDGLMHIAQKIIFNQDDSYVNIDTARKVGSIIAGAVAAILLTAGIIALGIVTGGAAWLAGAGLLGAAISGTLAVGVVSGIGVGMLSYNADFWGDSIALPLYNLAPEEIFEGRIGLFNVNFFNPDSAKFNTNVKEGVKKNDNIAEELQSTIAQWYKIIRGICLIAMLSVLVYMGIRILISSSAENKAKYKQLLVDWVIGLCLLFFMHYGMAFGNMFVDKITDALTAAEIDGVGGNESPSSEDIDETINGGGNIRQQYVELLQYEGKVKTAIEKSELSVGPEGDGNSYDITLYTAEDGKEYVWWPTNLMGHIRMQAEYARNINSGYWGYALMFIILICLLAFFIWTYLRRVLYMAFLTLIAPFVALTYPLDKVKDGTAQGFQFWFKEYLYNLLLQPLHLLLYTVLITSALELATKNPLYSIVTIGFLVPAEGLIRQMFGFKGNTPGKVPGAAGAALMFSGFKSLLSKAPNEKEDNLLDKAGSLATSNNKAKTRAVDYDAIQGGVGTTPTPGAGMTSTSGAGMTPTPGAGMTSTSGAGMTPTPGAGMTSTSGAGMTSTSGAGTTPTPGAGMTSTSGAGLTQRQKFSQVSKQLGRQVGRNMGRQLVNRVKKMKPARFLAGATLGMVGAGLGAAMGIASGDPSKAATYATTGFLAGNKQGRGIASGVGSFVGLDYATDVVNQMNMTDEQKKLIEAKKKIRSDEYRKQKDLEDEKTKKLLDTKMADGRTIRQATIEDGFSHEEQERIAKYVASPENQLRFGDLNSKNISNQENMNLAQNLFDEVSNTRKLSNNLGVDDFDSLDSGARRAKVEQIAKHTIDASEYSNLKKELQKAENKKTAAKTAQDKDNAQIEIDKYQKLLAGQGTGNELMASKGIINRLNTWGRTGID